MVEAAMAARLIVSLLDDYRAEQAGIQEIAAEFGLEYRKATNLAEAAKLNRCKNIAVLMAVVPPGHDWKHLLDEINASNFNRTKVILCHGPELVDFTSQMIAAGAYYPLLTPLVRTETRRALGFAWAHDRREKVHQIGSRAAIGASLHRLGAA